MPCCEVTASSARETLEAALNVMVSISASEDIIDHESPMMMLQLLHWNTSGASTSCSSSPPLPLSDMVPVTSPFLTAIVHTHTPQAYLYLLACAGGTCQRVLTARRSSTSLFHASLF